MPTAEEKQVKRLESQLSQAIKKKKDPNTKMRGKLSAMNRANVISAALGRPPKYSSDQIAKVNAAILAASVSNKADKAALRKAAKNQDWLFGAEPKKARPRLTADQKEARSKAMAAKRAASADARKAKSEATAAKKSALAAQRAAKKAERDEYAGFGGLFSEPKKPRKKKEYSPFVMQKIAEREAAKNK